MQQQLPVVPAPPGHHLGGGARLAAAAIVLVGTFVGSVVAFYGVGATMDALTGSGVAECDEQIACGIGVGFLMMGIGIAGALLGGVVAVVVPFVLPRPWSTARALGTAGVVVAAVVALEVVAMGLLVGLGAR